MKKVILYLLLVISVTLAITVAYVSISGLLTIFSGSGIVGLLFFSIIEISKVVATSAIHNYSKQIGKLYTYLLSLGVLIAMLITSIGVYGFLSSGYEKTTSKSENVDKEISLIVSKLEVNENNRVLTEKQLNSVRDNITQLRLALGNNTQSRVDKKGNVITTSSNANRRSFEKQLNIAISDEVLLNSKLGAIDSVINVLNEEKVSIEVKNNESSELGPLRYLSKVLNTNMDSVMKWFILLLIIIGDPMAILMIIIFNKIINRDIDNKTIVNDDVIVDINENFVKDDNIDEVKEYEYYEQEDDGLDNENVDYNVSENNTLDETESVIGDVDSLGSKIKLSDLPEVKKRNFSVNIPERRGNTIEHIGSNKEIRNGENKVWFAKR